MNKHGLLAKLRELGISLSLEDDRLKMSGPESALTPVLLAEIKAHKSEIIDFLKKYAPLKNLRTDRGQLSAEALERFADLEPQEEKEYYELSFSQKRLWFIHRLQPLSPAFNIRDRIMLDFVVDEEVIRRAMSSLMERHECFRTYFKIIAGNPCQFIAKQVDINLETRDISSLDAGTKEQERQSIFLRFAAIPFDLSRPPLFRLMLLKLEEAKYDLLFNIHHIISDGWSIEILDREFLLYYEAYSQGKKPELPALSLQYRDFAQWYNRYLASPQGQESHRFWKEKLSRGVPVMTLPVDRSPNRDNNSGAGYYCLSGPIIRQQLLRLAENNDVTLFVVLFSIFLLFLVRVSGQNDVACSIITAGRDVPGLQDICGFFVNSLLFTAQVDPVQSFNIFLQQVNRDMIAMFQHQAYPLEPVCQDLAIRYPQVPVSLNMVDFGFRGNTWKPANNQALHQEESQDVKFDLEGYIAQYSDDIFFFWAYRKMMFSPQMIEVMNKRYLDMSAFFGSHPGLSLADYKLQEKSQQAGKAGKKKFKKKEVLIQK